MMTLSHSPVHSDPSVMGGTLVFRASRVPAQTLLEYLDDGYTLRAVPRDVPLRSTAETRRSSSASRDEPDVHRP